MIENQFLKKYHYLMPKVIDYPLYSFSDCFSLASSLEKNKGSMPISDFAILLGRKKSGPFLSWIGACVKYGLLDNKNGVISNKELFRDIYYSHLEESKSKFIQSSILSIPLFDKLIKEIAPSDFSFLDKLLITKYQIPPKDSKKLKSVVVENYQYFSSFIQPLPLFRESSSEPSSERSFENNFSEKKQFSVSILGESFNVSFKVSGEDDFLILDAIIKKMEKIINS